MLKELVKKDLKIYECTGKSADKLKLFFKKENAGNKNYDTNYAQQRKIINLK